MYSSNYKNYFDSQRQQSQSPSYLKTPNSKNDIKQTVYSPKDSIFKYRFNSPANLTQYSMESTRNHEVLESPYNNNSNLSFVHKTPYDSLYTTDKSKYSSTISPTSRYTDLDYDYIAKKSTSNIISTFKELQTKVKILEKSRYDAIQEKDELNHAINNKLRDIKSWKNKNNFQLTDNLMDVRNRHEKLRFEYDDTQMKLNTYLEIEKSLDSGISAQKSLIESLHKNIHDLKLKIKKVEKHNQLLNEEFQAISSRNSNLANHVDETIPDDVKQKYYCLENEIKSLQEEINISKNSNKRYELKFDAMRRYMDLILHINGDLCETLVLREEKKENILRLAEKYTPPRYAWPRSLNKPNYQDILTVVNEAATASALEKTIDNNVLPSSTRRRNSTGSVGLSRRVKNVNVNATALSSGVRRNLNFKEVPVSSIQPQRNGNSNRSQSQLKPSQKKINLTRGELLEHRAAHAIAQAVLSPSLLRRTSSPFRSTSSKSVSNPISLSRPQSRSGSPSVLSQRNKSPSASQSLSATLSLPAFIPSSKNTMKKKEFNRVARSSIEDRNAFRQSAMSHANAVATQVASYS